MKEIREFGRKAAREPGRRNITAHQVEEAGKRRRSGFFGRFWIVILTVVLAAGLLPVPGQGGRVYAQDQPELTAKGAVVYCENTDEIVFAKGKNDKLSPYSITKLMTALLKAISLLADNPYMGAALAEKFEITIDVRYFVVSKQLIFYHVDEKNSTIEILRVLDGRTDYLSVLFG